MRHGHLNALHHLILGIRNASGLDLSYDCNFDWPFLFYPLLLLRPILVRLLISLPKWLVELYRTEKDKEFTSEEEMVALAVDIAARNVSENSGGPFGCAIFERDTVSGKARLFSCGANRVVPLTNSTLHAEMVAIQFAQKKLKTFSLSKATDAKDYVLCTSCEPCCMCLGGTMWSGVAELICSATKSDAEAIGFDEGPVFRESYEQLEKMGMKVKKEIRRAEGKAVLDNYGKHGLIYNA